MKIHHLRNATFVIEAGEKFILIDPMLGSRGSLVPFTFFRYKARRNPLVPLPTNSQVILEKVTDCLITHLHPDHLDKEGEIFLRERNIPVLCSIKDEKELKKRGLNVKMGLSYWKKQTYLGGEIWGIPAKHGYGWVSNPMGNVIGFHLELVGFPSIYISADTIYTDDVEKALVELKPDISVVAAGTARFDIGQPLLMKLDDIYKFVSKSPKKVFANHLEALNHCPTTRKKLKETLSQKGLLDKVYIPNDGENFEVVL
jgi:L-ascorbate metabolism protein UlaG (beta-lactamase superfamily)